MNKQRYLKKSISVLVFTIPALIPLFVFWVYPICKSVWISFTDWDYMTPTYHFVCKKIIFHYLKIPDFMRPY